MMPTGKLNRATLSLAAAWAVACLVAWRQAPGTDPTRCDWAVVRVEFDANHDGRLDAGERERLRRSRPMGFTCDPGRGTWDGGGEKKSRSKPGGDGRKESPPHPLAEFDTNRNGNLEASELAAARAAMRARSTPIPKP